MAIHMIDRAVKDLASGVNSAGNEKRTWITADEWLDAASMEPFGFGWVCHLFRFGNDIDRMRAKVRRQAEILREIERRGGRKVTRVSE